MNRDLARACRAAKIPRVSPNDLRRTFASLLVQDGVPLDVVAKLLGHSSAAMVYRVYGRFTPSALAELASPGVPKAPGEQRTIKKLRCVFSGDLWAKTDLNCQPTD